MAQVNSVANFEDIDISTANIIRMNLDTPSNSDLSSGLSNKVDKAGDTMTGSLFLNGDASSALEPVTFQQFQGAIAGFTVKAPCYAATTTNFAAIYNNGISGVGATLTGISNGVFATDGITPPINSRIYVLNQTLGLQKGIYNLTDTGSSLTPPILTRATDYDNSPAGEVTNGVYASIENGDTYGGTTWYLTNSGSITIGVTALSFAKINAPLAGAGLTQSTPNTLSVDVDNTSITFSGNKIQAAVQSVFGKTGAVDFSQFSSSLGIQLSDTFLNYSSIFSSYLTGTVQQLESALWSMGSYTFGADATVSNPIQTYIKGTANSAGLKLKLPAMNGSTSRKDVGRIFVVENTGGVNAFQLTANDGITNIISSVAIGDRYLIMITDVSTVNGSFTVLFHNNQFLQVSNNLSDLTSPSTARANLGLGTAATQNTSAFLQSSNNLSDVSNASTSRNNLGLGTAATQNSNSVAITGGNIDSTIIGATTAAAGSFTNLTVANTVTISGQNATTVPYLDASKHLVSSVVTPTELGFLSGASSSIQTQLNGKLIASNNLSDVSNASTSRNNLGLGTIATQNSNSVAITGGNIDNTVIGNTTQSAASVTTLSSTDTTDSSSSTTGAIKTAGGLGVAKKIYVGTGIVLPNTSLLNSTNLSYYEDKVTNTANASHAVSTGSLTFTFTRIGNRVWVTWPDFSFTATATDYLAFVGAIPTRFLPGQTVIYDPKLTNNSTNNIGTAVFLATGEIDVYTNGYNNFTSGNSCFFYSGSAHWWV